MCAVLCGTKEHRVRVCVRVNACWMGDWVDGGIDSWLKEEKKKSRKKKKEKKYCFKTHQSTKDASLSSLIHTGSTLTGRFCQGREEEKEGKKRKKKKEKREENEMCHLLHTLLHINRTRVRGGIATAACFHTEESKNSA